VVDFRRFPAPARRRLGFAVDEAALLRLVIFLIFVWVVLLFKKKKNRIIKFEQLYL